MVAPGLNVHRAPPIVLAMAWRRAILVSGLVTGCGGGGAGPSGGLDPDVAACPAGTDLFSIPPVAIGAMTGWVPLGNLNPPAHTFPTDHQYIYLADPGTTPVPPVVSVVAPGPVTIYRAKSTHYQETNRTDYAIAFRRCREVAGEFGHVQSLAPALASRIGAFDQSCSSYSPAPGTTVTQCFAGALSATVAAGDAIGTAGGTAGQWGLDLSLWDTRVTPIGFARPDRYPRSGDGFDYQHTVPASDYFAEPARSAIRAKLGRFDGHAQRTVAPYGGTIALDRAGTAQGNWFNPSQPSYPESAHLALVPDNVDPTIQVFSVGLSQPGLGAGTYPFAPTHQGTVNRDLSEVTANGTIYCYELPNGGVALLRLTSASALQVDTRPGPTRCQAASPYALAAGAATYQR
jgi:hypothetical protein